MERFQARGEAAGWGEHPRGRGSPRAGRAGDASGWRGSPRAEATHTGTRIPAVSPASLHEDGPVGADPDSAPVCSLVVMTYNHRELLDRCLASIRRHWPRRAEGTLELVVVDD